MAKYMKKPIVIDATQWFKNGDHPDDDCHMIHPDPGSATQFEPYLSEGAIVNKYLTTSEDHECSKCGELMSKHGCISCINILEGWHVVCPGDWIITGIDGSYCPVKNDAFVEAYEKVS